MLTAFPESSRKGKQTKYRGPGDESKMFSLQEIPAGVLSHYCLRTVFFSFSFPRVPQQKEQALRLVTIKPIFPKGKNNLTTKQIDTLEKYVVKIHSTGLRHKSEGASLCDQDFL